jgi:AraC-like DNA-binding protein
MSRAAFARRFTAAFGAPPQKKLLQERMRHAASMLQLQDDTLASIADEVGYRSEFAFGRAFKRFYGVAPGSYRQKVALVAPHGSPRMLLAA